MSMIGVHAGTAVIAVFLGLLVLASPKGTTYHRQVGWTYLFVLSLMVLTSFWIYELRSRLSVFLQVPLIVGFAAIVRSFRTVRTHR